MNDDISLATSLSFQDLSGKFPKFLKELRIARSSILSKKKTVGETFDKVSTENLKRKLQVSTTIKSRKKTKSFGNDDNDDDDDGVNSIHSDVSSDHMSFGVVDNDDENPTIVSDGISTDNQDDTSSPPDGNTEKETSADNYNMDRLKKLAFMYNKKKDEK